MGNEEGGNVERNHLDKNDVNSHGNQLAEREPLHLEVQAADGTIARVSVVQKEEELLVTLVSLSEPPPLQEFYQNVDSSSAHVQPLDGKTDPTEKLKMLALQRGNQDKLPEGKFNSPYGYSRFIWGFWLDNSTPSATLNFKGPVFVRYRILERRKLRMKVKIDRCTLRTVDDVCQDVSYKRYCYRSGSATFCPVWDDQYPQYCAEVEAKSRTGKPEIFRAQMEVDHTPLHKSLLDQFLQNHWTCLPLWGDSLDYTRVVLAQKCPCKPDILRWHRLCHRLYNGNEFMEDVEGWCRAIEKSKIQWDKFCQATMMYFMNPANLSDRRIARSRDEVYYVDRATVLIRKRTTASQLSYDNLPMAEVFRLEKKHRNTWWSHPKFNRALLLQRFFMKHLKLYVPHDAYECSLSKLEELSCEFSPWTEDQECISKPLLLPEAMPYTAYYFNCQLNRHLGLQQNHSTRRLLQKMVYLETCVLKLHAVQSNWDNNRSIVVPKDVIEKIKSTNIEDHDIGIRHHSTGKGTPSHIIIRRMENAIAWTQTEPSYINKMRCSLPGLGEISWFWVDQLTGEIDKSVPAKVDYYHEWRSRGFFPSKSDTYHGDPYKKHKPFTNRPSLNVDRRIPQQRRHSDADGYYFPRTEALPRGTSHRIPFENDRGTEPTKPHRDYRRDESRLYLKRKERQELNSPRHYSPGFNEYQMSRYESDGRSPKKQRFSTPEKVHNPEEHTELEKTVSPRAKAMMYIEKISSLLIELSSKEKEEVRNSIRMKLQIEVMKIDSPVQDRKENESKPVQPNANIIDLRSSIIELFKDEEVRKAMPGYQNTTSMGNIQSIPHYIPQFMGNVPPHLLYPQLFQQNLSALNSVQSGQLPPLMNSGVTPSTTLRTNNALMQPQSTAVPLATVPVSKHIETGQVVNAAQTNNPTSIHPNMIMGYPVSQRNVPISTHQSTHIGNPSTITHPHANLFHQYGGLQPAFAPSNQTSNVQVSNLPNAPVVPSANTSQHPSLHK